MPYPNAYVEIDFSNTQGPYFANSQATRIWTDVTSYARNINITRGRTDETSNFESGNASITLDNRDRRFDPFHATGPYYGKLKPRQAIRVRATNASYKNLVENPGFEQSYEQLGGWRIPGWGAVPGVGFTPTISTDARTGRYAAQLRATNGTDEGGMVYEWIPVTAGQQYNFSAYLKNIAGVTRQHRIDVTWWSATFGFVDISFGTGTNITAGGAYTRLAEVFTAPTNAVYAKMTIYFQRTNGANGNTTLVDDVIVSQGSTLRTFEDTTTLFQGYVEGWPVELTDAGYDSTVTISCFDLLGLLGQQELPDVVADWQVANTGLPPNILPRHFYKLTDPIDPALATAVTLRDDGWNTMPLTVAANTLVSNGSGLADGLAATSLNIENGSVASTPRPGNNRQQNGSTFTTACISVWWEITDPTVNEIIIENGLLWEVVAEYDFATDRILIDYYNGTQRLPTQSQVLQLDANIPHHLFIRYDVTVPTTTFTVCLDGQELTMTSLPPTAATRSLNEYTTLRMGRFQQVAVWDQVISPQQVAAIYGFGANRYPQSTTARANVIRSTSPVGLAVLTLPSSPYGTVSDVSVGGPAITAELQLIADSEGGNLYTAAAGQIVMTSRYAVFEGRSLTNQATFGTGGISIGPVARYRLDAATMRNQLSIGAAGDASVEISDTASIAEYGVNGGTWSTQLASIDDAETLGDMLVGHYKNPVLTLDPFEVNPAAVAADWETIMGLELLDRITVVVPQRTGADLTTKQLIQQIQWSITPGAWTCQLTGSTRFTNVFILDSSLLDGPDVLA